MFSLCSYHWYCYCHGFDTLILIFALSLSRYPLGSISFVVTFIFTTGLFSSYFLTNEPKIKGTFQFFLFIVVFSFQLVKVIFCIGGQCSYSLKFPCNIFCIRFDIHHLDCDGSEGLVTVDLSLIGSWIVKEVCSDKDSPASRISWGR